MNWKVFPLLLLLVALSPNAFAEGVFRHLFHGDTRDVGMGGNPFTTRDENTFFHPIRLLENRQAHLPYRMAFEDIYRERRSGVDYCSVSHLVTGIEGIVPLEGSSPGGVLALGFHQPRLRIDLPNKEEQDLDYTSGNRIYFLSYGRGLFSPVLKLGGSFRARQVTRRNLYDHTAEVVVSPFKWAQLGLGRSGWNLNDHLSLRYEDAFLDLPVNMVLTRDRYFLRTSIPENLRFCFEFEEDEWEGNEQLIDQTDFHFSPRGNQDNLSLKMVYDLSQMIRILLSWDSLTLNVPGDLYYEGQKFGKLSRFSFEKEGCLLGISLSFIQRHLIVGDYERINLNGEARGNVETWPFTSTVIDLLGERRYFRGEMEAEVDKIHLGYRYSKSPSTGFSTGVNYLQIIPESKLATWQPAFLVFGVKDMRKYYLSYKRVDALVLSAGFDYGFRGVDIRYSFAQFVPLSAERREAKGEPFPQPPSAVPVEREVQGGRFHLLSISYSFD